MEYSAKRRKQMPSSAFGLPDERKYPMTDAQHAANAKARATQMLNAGKITEAEHRKIFRRANKILK